MQSQNRPRNLQTLDLDLCFRHPETHVTSSMFTIPLGVAALGGFVGLPGLVTRSY